MLVTYLFRIAFDQGQSDFEGLIEQEILDRPDGGAVELIAHQINQGGYGTHGVARRSGRRVQAIQHQGLERFDGLTAPRRPCSEPATPLPFGPHGAATCRQSQRWKRRQDGAHRSA